MIDVDVVVPTPSLLGEGPVWDGGRQRLLWLDIEGRLLHATDVTTGADTVVELGAPVGMLAPRASGGFVLAAPDGLRAIGDDLGDGSILLSIALPAGLRFNDGKCDPNGRLLVGSMGLLDSGARGTLYRIDADRTVRPVLSEVACSNGLAWSADGRILYFIDSLAKGIDAFAYDPATGQLSNRRRLVEVDDGLPDGMTIDREGCLWVAVWGGSAVRRFSPAGELVDEIRLPVSLVTCPTFGGPDLDTLYITTATTALSPTERAAQPLAGSLFACRPGTRGHEPTPFAG